MKILWIPHTSWDNCKSRDQYFIKEMKKDHEIHVLTWAQLEGSAFSNFLNPKLHINGFQSWDKKDDGVYLHHYSRIQNTSFTPNLLKMNEKKFQKKIREIVKNYNIDAIICGPSYYLNGFPPFDVKVPIIFDYLDYIDDKHVRDIYLKNSDAVLCVSHSLLDYSSKYNEKSHYLPNPINITELSKGNGDRVKEEHNLYGSTIITLIGLSIASTYYFIDTFPIVKRKIKNAKYLIVGRNHYYQKMKKKAKKFEDIIFTGWVNNVEDYFVATDIGVYPVDKTIYDDSRCPIKILEYTALKKPVVSTNILEVIHWNFPNVFISKPNCNDFSRGIIRASKSHCEFPNINSFRIETLTNKLTKILREV